MVERGVCFLCNQDGGNPQGPGRDRCGSEPYQGSSANLRNMFCVMRFAACVEVSVDTGPAPEFLQAGGTAALQPGGPTCPGRD